MLQKKQYNLSVPSNLESNSSMLSNMPLIFAKLLLITVSFLFTAGILSFASRFRSRVSCEVSVNSSLTLDTDCSLFCNYCEYMQKTSPFAHFERKSHERSKNAFNYAGIHFHLHSTVAKNQKLLIRSQLKESFSDFSFKLSFFKFFSVTRFLKKGKRRVFMKLSWYILYFFLFLCYGVVFGKTMDKF